MLLWRAPAAVSSSERCQSGTARSGDCSFTASAGTNQLLAEVANHAVVAVRVGVAPCLEHRGSRHEGVGARPSDLGDIVHLDATVHLQADIAAEGVDAATRLAQLVQGGGQ